MNYTRLTATLKTLLRTRGLRYEHVAQRIGMSESGLKKVLNADDGHLGRLLSLCDVAGVTLAQLLELAAESTPWRLTDEQEQLFIDEPALYHFLWALKDAGWDLPSTQLALGLDDAQVDGWLAKLENRQVLRRTGAGQIVGEDAAGSPWQAGKRFGAAVVAPLQDQLLAEVRAAYERGDEGPRECGLSRMTLTEAHMAELRDELRALAARYGQRSSLDRHRAPADQLVELGLMSVMGPWRQVG